MARVRTMARVRGQVLPLAVCGLLACSLLLVFIANSSQLVDEKIRLVNAADSAAYSAGIVEARGLNYLAYANRAIIANQVAIAQAVSLASWTNYFADLWMNLGDAEARLLELVPPSDLLRWATIQVTFAGEAYATAFGGVDPRQIAQYVNTGAAAIITASDLASQGLALSEVLVRESLRGAEFPSSPARQTRLGLEAARTTDPAASIEIVPLTHGFDTFVRNYTGHARSRLADVVERSRDGFTSERAWTLNNALSFLDDKRYARRGGTHLRGFDAWTASDSLTFRSSGGLFGGATKDHIARSSIELNSAPTSTSRSTDYYLPALYTGLPSVYDVRDLASSTPLTGLSVLAFKPRSSASLSRRAASSGRLQLFESSAAPSDKALPMAALSRAEVFFASPADHGGPVELGSLYSPYWRVRLVPPMLADKAFAAARQQGLALP